MAHGLGRDRKRRVKLSALTSGVRLVHDARQLKNR
jgi:hypothetical protein